MKRTPLYFVLGAFVILFTAGTLDLSNLYNYANQNVPNYITKDNTGTNTINDKEATLGRVLFYDKSLSVDNSIACASCHLQQFAFGDTAQASVGVNGTTGRHSMRLINTRFADEIKFFWDERANTLEDQVIQPIQDHTEMGFSGLNGDPDFDSAKRKIASLEYYKTLFNFVYNDTLVTTQRIQHALAQFVRSIQSFDSKFDSGFAQAPNLGAPFVNFTNQENAGKQLYLAPPQFNNQGVRIGGGAGCQGCHRAPEFDIDSASRNNGVIGSLTSTAPDFTNTKAPTLRDLLNSNGTPNTRMMHTGAFTNINGVINHYNQIPAQPNNPNLDNRLRPGGNFQNLNLSNQEIGELVAFLRTLTGNDVYTNPKWSNPFTNDSISINVTTAVPLTTRNLYFTLFPNPCSNNLYIKTDGINMRNKSYTIISIHGGVMLKGVFDEKINVSNLSAGVYFLQIDKAVLRFVKQ